MKIVAGEIPGQERGMRRIRPAFLEGACHIELDRKALWTARRSSASRATVSSAVDRILEEYRPPRLSFKGATGAQTRLYMAILGRCGTDLKRLGYRVRRGPLRIKE